MLLCIDVSLNLRRTKITVARMLTASSKEYAIDVSKIF